MALVRFKAAVDYVTGHAKAFGTNTGFIQAVTLVDSTGADASATLPTGAATEATLAAASAKLPAALGAGLGMKVEGTVAAQVAAAGGPVQVGGVVNASPAAVGAEGTAQPFKVDARGYLHTTIGVGGASVVTSTGVSVVNKGATTGGLSSARVVTGTTGVIKGSAGTLFALSSVQNANAGVRYLHLYNKASAPTLSTDTPILTITLAATSVQNNINFTAIGAAFSTGIAWAYTTDNIAIPTTAGTSTELMFSASYA